RIGVVLTPEGGALQRMLLPFKLGLGGRIGSGRQWVSWIGLEDLIQVLRVALFDER
ncbi:MAG: TIGR01777 family protein, partial [Gammaproteobacteria bacterium]|nr:TIGR01777 family protein [Gammaproteobacteria bacterium]